ncbi:MAG: hypothetical protein A6F70_08650 [Cycloclasticus sp. symbiont of Bathymodiolus heckerae]|nr:MAG: hypothetical protein A6F70_08650 [Cycloclasticus sp. symbiont of Bathymodiolus heckerae]
MNAFLLALQFLTRIPIPFAVEPTPKNLGDSVLYYPLIGAIIGFFLFAAAHLLADVDTLLSAALILTLWIGLTGGLHLDGIADCVDGWIGGQGNIEKSLHIMKDPNAGPMGVTALVLLLLLKYAALTVLLNNNALSILLIAPIIGRASVLFLMISTNYIRANGLAETMIKNLPRNKATVIVLIVIILYILIANIWSALLLTLFACFLRHLFISLFNGITGDMLGASVELNGLAILLIAALL